MAFSFIFSRSLAYARPVDGLRPAALIILLFVKSEIQTITIISKDKLVCITQLKLHNQASSALHKGVFSFVMHAFDNFDI
jgi:hypothetical protein